MTSTAPSTAPPAQEPTAGPGAGRSHPVLCVAAWALAFAGTVWLADRWLPPRELPPLVRQKMAFLDEHGGDYDMLFVGSSRVQYHVMPSVFDALMAEHGLSVKSFNVGISGMLPPEDGFVLDEILRRPHGRLRWIILEMGAVRTEIDPAKVGTARLKYWHDWERFVLVSQRAWQRFTEARKSLAKKRRTPWQKKFEKYEPIFAEWVDHAELFAAQAVNLGRGSILTLAPEDPANAKPYLGSHYDGWAVATEAAQHMQGETLAKFESAYAARLRSPVRQDTNDRTSDVALAALVAKIKRAGVQPILFIPPTPDLKRYWPPPERIPGLTIFDFSDVERYPELFKNENRQDLGHLNAAGAEVFTHLLAQRFLELQSPP